ncbi:hypothetical protein MKX01_030043 [Papaver californicum]|nr:hypothetical protein MKX01_030043 [Papaver californicum]
MHDIPGIQACNFLCFLEEDPRDSCYYQDFFWPRLFYVAADYRTGHILGYVIAMMGGERHGYILYLGVRPTHRQQGIAEKLMTTAENAMEREYGSGHVSLCVRTKNVAAILFTEKLGYETQDTTPEFYDNGKMLMLWEKK